MLTPAPNSYAVLGRSLPAKRVVAPVAPSRESGDSPNSRSGLQAAARLLPDMSRIIRPGAALNWMACSSVYTPQYIDMILRGAMSGSPVQIHELFDLMEDTWPRLSKNLNELKRAVLGMDWQLEPWHEEDQPPTPEADYRAKLVSNAVWKMRPDPAGDENGLEQTIFDILDAWAKGTSVLEIIWEQRQDRALGSFIAPQSTIWVHPNNYAWGSDGRLGLMLEDQFSTSANARRELSPFPEDKFLIAICKAKSGHPLAGALLRPLAFWWCAANFTAEWFLNLAQIFGLPIRWANYDPNVPGLVDKVCDMLENMGSAAWGAFPAGTTLDIKEPLKGGTDNPQVALLDRADRNCDILILGQTLTTEVGASGSRALGDVHKTVRDEVVAAAADFAEGIINNQLVPAILRQNYGDSEDAPEFCAEPEAVEDVKANAERDQILLTQGIEMPRDWFYKRHNIPLPQPGEETITGRAPASPMDALGLAPTRPTRPTRPPGPTEPQPDAELQAQRAKAPADPEATIDSIVTQAVADGVGARRQWLAPLAAEIQRLIAVAKTEHLTDADVVRLVEAGRARLPDLFTELDVPAFAKHLTAAAGTAARVALESNVAASRKSAELK